MRKFRIAPPTRYARGTKTALIEFTPEEHARVRKIADAHGVSLRALARQAFYYALDNLESDGFIE